MLLYYAYFTSQRWETVVVIVVDCLSNLRSSIIYESLPEYDEIWESSFSLEEEIEINLSLNALMS